MGGDYTRFTFKAAKNYSGVLKQQGRVALDSDWNELSDIADRKWRSETFDIIGQCVVPNTTPDAFGLTPTGSGTFDIGIGRAYVDGIQTENHGLDPQRYDPILGENQGITAVPYSDQPFWPAPLPPSLTAPALPPILGRTDLIYLDVWQREVTVIEDPGIREIALGGPDTTTRVQTAWQVKAIPDVSDAACPDPIPRWDDVVRPSGGRLTTSTLMPPPDDNPCIIAAAGGYRGVENRLYRVEIHTPGGLGTARFKWSRNNASIVSEVEAISASADQITVRQIGRDQILRFNVGDWIEITDDYLEFQGQPGHLGQITNIDEANRIMTIHSAIPGSLNLDPTDATRHTRVRRWDQSSGVDADGLLSVTAGPVDIEDGLQVSFSLDPSIAGGEFKTGDYWVFYARTADGSVEPLAEAPPRGVQHHYCRLAFVTWGANAQSTFVRDCRTFWPPAKCCPIAVRPGEDIQAAIDRVPEEGGCICLLPGIHRVYRPLLIDGKKHLTLMGVGIPTKVVFAPLGPAHAAQALLYVVGASLDIEIKQMLVYADVLEHLFLVDEASREVNFDQGVWVNASTTQDARPDCILLGQCCEVTVSNCRMVGAFGIVQADRQTLERARTALALWRPPEAPEEEPSGEGPAVETAEDQAPAPVVVTTLRELHIEQNRLHFAETGIELQDVLKGGIEKNRLTAITFGLLNTFSRAANQLPPGPDGVDVPLALEDFFRVLESHFEALSVCPLPVPAAEEQPEDEEQGDGSAIPPDTAGIMACVVEDMQIRRNGVLAATGVALDYSRFVNVDANGITANAAGVLLQYGFDDQIEANTIRIARADNLTQEEEQMDLSESLRGRYRPGDYGIGFRFGRGLRINSNAIQAPTAIGVRSVSWRRCKEISADALIRILRIERPFKAFVELSWFLYQLILLLSAGDSSDSGSTGNAADAGVAQTQKEQFGLRMLRWYEGFINSSLFPAFVGKTEIADNRLNVSRFGVFLYKVFSVSGLRILRNRISGFRKTGILVQPWYAVGFADKFARAMRCVVTWIIVFLTMLRDGLRGFIDGQEPGEQPGGGFASGVPGVITAGVSWILMICSRYCAGTQPPTEDGADEEPPPSPVEVLVDELDDFLDHVSLTWLDDLVNQAYDIDRNVLAGSGDGIWTGMDGSRIIGNKVTIWPISTVPYETVIFGILLNKNFENTNYYSSDIAFVTESATQMDRDLVVYGLLNLLWPGDFIGDAAFQNQFRSFLAELAAQVDASSPLLGPIRRMQQGLSGATPDLEQFAEAWFAFLAVMIRDLRGYGIVMRGANMVCRHNRVEAQTGCQGLFAGDDQANPDTDAVFAAQTFRYPWGRQALFGARAIGGIWQFSNLFGLFLDLLDLVLHKPEDREYIYQLLIWVIFLLVLFFEKERSLAVNANTVESALVNGIRTFTDWRLRTDIFDNTVHNASRHGILHVGFLTDNLIVKVHRNTVIHEDGSSAFVAIEARGGDFSSLISVFNGQGTTLMSHNHGSGDDLDSQDSAVFVDTDVAGISANHVLTDSDLAFEVSASPTPAGSLPRGLFTDNMTNKNNDISPANIVQGPDITNL